MYKGIINRKRENLQECQEIARPMVITRLEMENACTLRNVIEFF